MGWFDGDSATLQPLSRLERAGLLARLAGGEVKILSLAEKLSEEGQWQSVLELTSQLLQLRPEDRKIRDLRVMKMFGRPAMKLPAMPLGSFAKSGG